MKLVKWHHEPPVVLYFSSFPGWLAWFSLQMFCLNNTIHYSQANANNSARFNRKMVLNHRFCSFTTTNKLVNEAANDSARVSGQDRKKLPALGTNQIAGFGGFRPLASFAKNKYIYWSTIDVCYGFVQLHRWNFLEATWGAPLLHTKMKREQKLPSSAKYPLIPP